MGCHTWVYKKVSALSADEQKRLVEKQIHRFKNDIVLRLPFDVAVQMVESWGEPNATNWVKKYKERYEKAITDMEQNGITALKPLDEDIEVIMRNGELYSYIDFDRPLRVFGYPEETFYNKKDLIKWLKKTKYEFGDYILGEFVPGYNKDLEKNINDYFSKHGENNLYIEFG